MNSCDDRSQPWWDDRTALKSLFRFLSKKGKGERSIDVGSCSFYVDFFCLPVWKKDDKQKFSLKIVETVESRSGNYYVMEGKNAWGSWRSSLREVYGKYLDNKPFEAVIRRLFKMCQISDWDGKRCWVSFFFGFIIRGGWIAWVIKVEKPANNSVIGNYKSCLWRKLLLTKCLKCLDLAEKSNIWKF